MNVQNKKTNLEEVRVVIDQQIVDTVYQIFEDVLRLNQLEDVFEDLAERLIGELYSNSFMEYNLELTDDQKAALRKVVASRGFDAVNKYLSNINADERSRAVYDVVQKNCAAIVDAALSSIGQAVNRGAIINAIAVQANAKNEDYDEILLRKTKSSGDITIPTYCILLSTNCVEVIKNSCLTDLKEESIGAEDDGEENAGEAGAGQEVNF